MMLRLFFAALLLCAGAATAHEAAGPPARVADAVSMVGMDGRVETFDAARLQSLAPVEVEAATHGAPAARWTGVPLVKLAGLVGTPVGDDLRGRGLAIAVRVTASDGYQVVFGLGELDDGFGATTVLLAFRRDGAALGDDGPFRLVVPADRRGGRWARNVARVEVLDLRVDAPSEATR